MGGGQVDNPPHLLLGQDYRQQAVLEAVVKENVGEAGGDDAADAIVVQGPGGVFPGGAAAEVAPGHQDVGGGVGRLVQHELRPGRAVLIKAPTGKEMLAVAGAADAFEMHRRDDGVGVNVDPVDGGGHAGKFYKRLHKSPLNYQISRRFSSNPGSTRSPDTVAGLSSTSAGASGR